VIVEVEPSVEGSIAVLVAAVDADVCPFLGEGAVEPFDFSVGAWCVGPGASVDEIEVGAQLGPGVAAVAGAVIGQDAFDGDVVHREPVVGTFEEPGAAFGVFGGEDLAVCDAAVRVDRGMETALTLCDSRGDSSRS